MGENSIEVTGLVTKRGRYNVDETVRRFSAAAQSVGLLIFADINHEKNAVEAGLSIWPTRLIIFGNPKGGTPMMQLRQTAGIDLPFKVLIWEDELGGTWLSYNDPQWLADRHGIGGSARQIVKAIDDGMAKLVAAATT